MVEVLGMRRRDVLRATALGLAGAGLSCLPPAFAQGAPSWASPDLLAAAKAEGGEIIIYGSMNEQEALPLWKAFETATAIKVQYVRSSDTGLMSRILLEARAQQKSWDLVVTTAVSKLPQEFLTVLDLPEAKNLDPKAIDPKKKWYGVYSNYNTPSYNTKFVDKANLPKTYEEMATRKDWAGKVAIDATDSQWVYAMFDAYGEQKARKVIGDLVANLKPVVVDGHLALARSVGLGEYWVALNNYTNLTINVSLKGGDTDYWALDPVGLFFGQAGVNVRAPHPRTAQLATNFLVSKDAQKLLTEAGRLPVRPDVAPNPPDAIKRFGSAKIVAVNFTPEDEKKWQRITTELLKPR
jgi:iron(III) transport system substrate-binding protein